MEDSDWMSSLIRKFASTEAWPAGEGGACVGSSGLATAVLISQCDDAQK